MFGNGERIADGDGDRVAGERMGEAAARTSDHDAGDPHFVLIGGEIATGQHRQDTAFMADGGAVRPAVLARIAVDPRGERAAIEHRIIGVVCVLDEHVLFAQRQDVDKAIGPAIAVRRELVDARIHDHRPLEPVRFGQAHVPAEEDLPPAAQVLA